MVRVLRLERDLVEILPAPEKIYSDKTDVAGTDKAFKAAKNKLGNDTRLSNQYARGSRYLGVLSISSLSFI